jgi:predicted permease
MHLYRALLHLYPAAFRAEYGEEMAAIFRRRLREANNGLSRLALWIGVAGETVWNALAVHGDILGQDLRYTIRTLNRSRGFAATAIVIVALGIGANTAAFSITDFVLLRPLPFFEPERLVTLWQNVRGYSRMELSPANYRDWTHASTSFERIGAFTDVSTNLVGTGEPERLEGTAVSATLFPTLGVRPALGRAFTEGDDREGAPATVVLSDRLWRTVFGADAGVIGRKITLDDRPVTVIGVMGREFSFPTSRAELWVPLVLDDQVYADRNNTYLRAIGRLRPGASLASARTELTVIANRFMREYPKENENTGATLNALHEELSGGSRTMVLALSGAAVCVMLIVCANLISLLLTRALGRRQELAVRTALGAGRERLIRQLATESALLGAVGGGLGILLAIVVVPLLYRLVPATLPTSATPSVDLRVLVFATVLTGITVLLFGLAPVLRTGAEGESGDLRHSARAVGGKERVRGALVVAEVVASIILLVVTGLLMRALWTIQARDPGFRPENVVTLRTTLPWPKYEATARRADFYSRVTEQVRQLPGVSNAAYISFLPMVMRGGIWSVEVEGQRPERSAQQSVSLRFVTPGLFASLGIPVRAGRDVLDADGFTAQPVAVVSESFAARHWPGQDPLGRRFKVAFKERTIVGVVGNVRVRGLERDSEPQVYLPNRQIDDGWMPFYAPKDLVIRASMAPDQLVPAIREIIRRVDPLQPVSDVRRMVDIIDAETASRSVQVRVLAGFATVAFLLAAIGIHGVLSFAVSQRTAEIGVRLALGAQRRDIIRLVMRRGLVLVAAALVPGLALAYASGLALQSLLMGVTPGDLPTFAAATATVVVMAVAGTLLPTVRALSVNPVTAIRSA